MCDYLQFKDEPEEPEDNAEVTYTETEFLATAISLSVCAALFGIGFLFYATKYCTLRHAFSSKVNPGDLEMF
jgi:hypothetical protein